MLHNEFRSLLPKLNNVLTRSVAIETAMSMLTYIAIETAVSMLTYI